MTISNELGLVSTRLFDQYALIVIKRKLFKPFHIVFPPCKVSNPTYCKIILNWPWFLDLCIENVALCRRCPSLYLYEVDTMIWLIAADIDFCHFKWKLKIFIIRIIPIQGHKYWISKKVITSIKSWSLMGFNSMVGEFPSRRSLRPSG